MIESIIRQYEPITLEQMSGIKLMNRTDTKFVTSRAVLCRLLELARSEYRVQETDGFRVAPYHTVYYDTPACDMYMAHHNGHLNRQKVRIRSYVASDLHFLEIKTKDNHRRTHKKRMTLTAAPMPAWTSQLHSTQGEVSDFLKRRLRYDHEVLMPSIENEFKRITLVNRGHTERLTIDSALRFHNLMSDRVLDLDGVVIIELKRDGLVPSPILELLRQLRVKPHGFSKYCMGLAMTDAQLKQNCFKERMRSVQRFAENK